ncbi:hypothetical protein [Halosolutus gelatinilyticus]|uniref:hypothetical protein n=1 Tax=Halosolutus gelatinilyticus TaxID=2931975 RepID=UPI001FF39391|nr:hypothetical protein [Halosolutus gelatinilyticus]
MAPAIVHFLVGAALVLLLAAPLALRGGASRHHLWFVAIGGLWGMSPDFHKIAPAFRAELNRVHGSPWADLFAFHYTLDRPPFDTNPIQSTAAAVALFVVAVSVFTAADSIGARTRRGTRSGRHALAARALVSSYAIAITGVLAGAVVGVAFARTGRIDSLAALFGRETNGVGWALLLALSWAATAAFAALVAIVDARLGARNPVSSAVLGLCFAVAAWAVGVTVGVPVWMRVMLARSRPIPYVHRASFVALVGFGLVLGVAYPIVRRLVAPPDRAGS